MADRANADVIVGGTKTWKKYEAADGSILFENISTGNVVKIDESGTVITPALDVGTEITDPADNTHTNALVSDVTGTGYEIQKDGTDGAGVINFKTV